MRNTSRAAPHRFQMVTFARRWSLKKGAGPYWALLILVPGIFVLAVRILDDEKMLEQELAGYRDYARKVRYRLLPYVW
jgi:protein-S-isoprenylcysteine O-methyltransferase Ste14